MTTDHSPSLDEIREAAEAAIECAIPGAEPRRWEAYFNRHGDPYVVPAGHLPNYQIAQVSTAPEDYGRALATYIAMMDPQTTLGLLERLEAAKDALREIWWLSEGCSVDAQTIEEQHEAMATEAHAALESLIAFTEANPTPGEDD